MPTYERKTGPGWAYIYCDVCGAKIRQKDAVLITDRYNTQYGLLVCKADVDRTNQQNIPLGTKETQVQNPRLLSSEPPDTIIENPNDDRVPSAPQNVAATVHPLNSTVVLNWQGPQDNGSGPIIGYNIYRAFPQFTGLELLVDNTNSTATYYEDTTAYISQYYTYVIRAINTFGIGPASDNTYFPTLLPDITPYSYLVTSQDLDAIVTENGDYIVTL